MGNEGRTEEAGLWRVRKYELGSSIACQVLEGGIAFASIIAGYTDSTSTSRKRISYEGAMLAR